MSVDALLVENLLYRSVDVGYKLPQGNFYATIPPRDKVVIFDITYDNLQDNVKTVLIPRKDVRVSPYELSADAPVKNINWIWSGANSHVLSTSSHTGTILKNAGFAHTSILEHAIVSGLVKHGCSLSKLVTALASLTAHLGLAIQLSEKVTGSGAVTFVSMAVVTAGCTACSTYSGIPVGSGATGSNGTVYNATYNAGVTYNSCSWIWRVPGAGGVKGITLQKNNGGPPFTWNFFAIPATGGPPYFTTISDPGNDLCANGLSGSYMLPTTHADSNSTGTLQIVLP
jgi:hypothetical protein